jgi:head-tail adaptor
MTIIAGNMRRTLIVKKLVKIRDEYGSEVDTYNPVMTLKAELVVQKGALGLTNYEIFNSSILTFLIYYRPINFTDRIEYEGKDYKILDTDEINFREQLRITMQLINV